MDSRPLDELSQLELEFLEASLNEQAAAERRRRQLWLLIGLGVALFMLFLLGGVALLFTVQRRAANAQQNSQNIATVAAATENIRATEAMTATTVAQTATAAAGETAIAVAIRVSTLQAEATLGNLQSVMTLEAFQTVVASEQTATAAAIATQQAAATETIAAQQTVTAIASLSVTPTPTPSSTATPTISPTPTRTHTPAPRPTAIPTSTEVPTSTPVPTHTPVPTNTAVPTNTPPTPTDTFTSTPTPTDTLTPTPTPTDTLTPTPTPTPRVADLQVTMTDSKDPVSAGDILTYELAITNNGPADATNVELTNNLPIEGVSFESAEVNEGGSCDEPNGSLVTCHLTNLETNGSVTAIIVVMVNSSATGSLCNTGIIKGDEIDMAPGNNQATECTGVEHQVDLSLEKNVSDGEVSTGDSLTYTLQVKNNSAATATGVNLVDHLPDMVTFMNVQPEGICQGGGSVVECQWNELTSGSEDSVTIEVTVNESTDEQVIVNSAQVHGNEVDPKVENNVDDAGTRFTPREANLSVTLDDSADPVTFEEEFTYMVTVTNSGPDDATGVQLSIDLPAGVSPVTADGCPVENLIDCNLGDIPVNGPPKEIPIKVKPNCLNNEIFVASVRITANERDPDEGNNRDDESTECLPAGVDLSLRKWAGSFVMGKKGMVTYKLTVTNNGPLEATNVILTDNLPDLVTFWEGDNCWAEGKTVTCEPGNIPPGGSVTTKIFGAVKAGQGLWWEFTNDATVSAAEDDPKLDNNHDSVTIMCDVTILLIISCEPTR